jgi:rare lipoprotein A
VTVLADGSGRERARWLIVALALGLPAACARHPKPAYVFPPAERPAVGTVVEGVASWYGPGYHGNRASSGERYDQDQLTAAHPYWAFGTRVKVTLLSNGRSVVVRINDRFPAHKGRAIDVSRAAARAIGLIGPGTGQVRLEIVE